MKSYHWALLASACFILAGIVGSFTGKEVWKVILNFLMGTGMFFFFKYTKKENL